MKHLFYFIAFCVAFQALTLTYLSGMKEGIMLSEENIEIEDIDEESDTPEEDTETVNAHDIYFESNSSHLLCLYSNSLKISTNKIFNSSIILQVEGPPPRI